MSCRLEQVENHKPPPPLQSVAMDGERETNNSIKLGSSSGSTNHEMMARSISKVHKTLLSDLPLHLQICRVEFAALLLKAVGPSKITTPVVNILFNEIDNDNDGWIRIEEIIARYSAITTRVHRKQQNRDRCRFVARRLVNDRLGNFLSICSGIISMAKNKFSRFYDIHAVAGVLCGIGTCLSFLGGMFWVVVPIYKAIKQLRSTMPQGFSAKVWLLASLLFTTDLAAEVIFVIGAIAYIVEQLLLGGIFYLIGSLLYFLSLYEEILGRLVQDHNILNRLSSSFSDADLIVDELDTDCKAGFHFSKELEFHDSITTKDDSAKLTRREYKRFLTYSHLQSKEKPLRARIERAPTFPYDGFRRNSLVPAEEEQITDAAGRVQSDNNVSLLALNMSLNKELDSTQLLYCYDVFKTLSKDNPANLDHSFCLVRNLCMSNPIDQEQLVSEKSINELRYLAFRRQFHFPLFYKATLYSVGSFLFIFGELPLAFSLSAVQNIYLVGSALFFCGNAGYLYHLWLKWSNDWELMQEIRRALSTLVSGADLEIDLEPTIEETRDDFV